MTAPHSAATQARLQAALGRAPHPAELPVLARLCRELPSHDTVLEFLRTCLAPPPPQSTPPSSPPPPDSTPAAIPVPVVIPADAPDCRDPGPLLKKLLSRHPDRWRDRLRQADKAQSPAANHDSSILRPTAVDTPMAPASRLLTLVAADPARAANPRAAGRSALIEACRRLATAGAAPECAAVLEPRGEHALSPECCPAAEWIRGVTESGRAFWLPVQHRPGGDPAQTTPLLAVVGRLAAPADLTPTWFVEQGDAVLLLGEPIHVDGAAVVDSDPVRTLHATVLGLIQAGGIRSAFPTADEGLAVGLATAGLRRPGNPTESRALGAVIDLPDHPRARLDTWLFGGGWTRMLLTTRADDAAKTVARAALLGVPALRLGTVGGDRLIFRTIAGECSVPMAELQAAWTQDLPPTP